jgi:signal transduction histidine kinase
MKTTRTRLAILAAAAVIVVMLAAAIAFNLFLNWKVEADAVGAIENAIGLNDNGTESGRSPNNILIDSSYQIDPMYQPWYTSEEKELVAWFAEHPEMNVVNRVTFDDWTCFAAISLDEGFFEDDSGYLEFLYANADGPLYYISYIDVTSEQSLIANVNFTFALIALIGAGLAAVAGYFAGKRIDEAQAAQKRFYENMSHELKTPLAAIQGFAEGARNGVIDVDSASRSIERESERATEMINEILGLSRLEAGTVEAHKETLVVNDFVQDCLMPFEGVVRSRGLIVQLDLDNDHGTVTADLDLFEHALSNVLTNAMRHAATTVRICCDSKHIAIWNDGNTPTPEQLTHLFDRFYTGEGGSTGIGLAIAREIAALHGWSITARIVNNGLEITFTF